MMKLSQATCAAKMCLLPCENRTGLSNDSCADGLRRQEGGMKSKDDDELGDKGVKKLRCFWQTRFLKSRKSNRKITEK